jgi:Ca-activated chloride channel family protein
MKKLSLVSSSVLLLMVLSGCGSKMVGKVEEASMMIPAPVMMPPMEVGNTERYKHNDENHFKDALSSPLSTFSIDVDTASYANARRIINEESVIPPKDAVRSEEFINYFSYKYQEPVGSEPFFINLKVGDAVWDTTHKLIQIGIQTKKPEIEKLPPSNFVFLLDVSGSMNDSDKLPLLKQSLKLLTNQLRDEDRVSIVVYAGSAGLVLDRAKGTQKEKIINALDNLEAGGSTAGGEGIELAYEIAKKSFISNGNNRVILATDGDFNVGVSSESALISLIEEQRKSGVYLSVLGFGGGNYKDDTAELLADKGNGNYSYIDTLLEAKKVLVSQMSGTLYTVAKDVKIQVEFNPKKVRTYKLLGYENRALANEDFNDDKKDAGEIGMGHSVTVLYEVVLNDGTNGSSSVDKLKYQTQNTTTQSDSNELATLKLRYKEPTGENSKLISKVIDDNANDIGENDFKFAQAVGAFSLLLRDSAHKGNANYKDILSLAKSAKGNDEEGYRADFIKVVEKTMLLKELK